MLSENTTTRYYLSCIKIIGEHIYTLNVDFDVYFTKINLFKYYLCYKSNYNF